MTKAVRIIACAALTVLIHIPVGATVIKVGSLAPEGSPWDTALKKMAAEWKALSEGTIELKIYPGGIVGNEPDMIRKMRIGQLQAAAFTGMGMSYIAPEVFALSLPFLVRDDDELDYLMDKTAVRFAKLIEDKGFVVVVWSKAGWVNFFSKKPVVYPADLRQQKIAVAESEPEMHFRLALRDGYLLLTKIRWIHHGLFREEIHPSRFRPYHNHESLILDELGEANGCFIH